MEYELWETKWKEIAAKTHDEGYNTLSEDERILYNIRLLIDSVDDLGIMSYFYNPPADYLEETIEDLKKIECYEIVTVLQDLCEVFPNKMPSKDVAVRKQLMESWGEDSMNYPAIFDHAETMFYEYEEHLEEKIEPIVKRVLSNE